MAPLEVRRQARETDRRSACLARMCGHEQEAQNDRTSAKGRWSLKVAKGGISLGVITVNFPWNTQPP